MSQTYGAVSVVLSAIALAGVALSLLYQVRQARTSNEQAIRDSHLQLATLALSDPNLLQAWSPPVAPVTLKRHRQHLITSLALGKLLQCFRIGHLSVEKLAVKLDGHFRGEIAREQWEREGPGVVELHRTTCTASGTVVEFAIGVHAASRFAWEYDFKVPDSAQDAEGQR
ncbi:DUF6082 family protein [Streptomyces niveus]|uniref:DUF6082 family protein n=1 Tax=Streptomyces niveus TaxID=193462 RepID=UPI0036483482